MFRESWFLCVWFEPGWDGAPKDRRNIKSFFRSITVFEIAALVCRSIETLLGGHIINDTGRPRPVGFSKIS